MNSSSIRSGSPATDALLLILLLFGLIIAIIFGAMFLIPIGIAIGVVKGIQWYVNRPIPTDRLYAQTEQRSVSANFPDTEQFVDAFLDRMLDALGNRSERWRKPHGCPPKNISG
jgi:hypothetical protein